MMHMNARLLASNECAPSRKGSKLPNNARLEEHHNDLTGHSAEKGW